MYVGSRRAFAQVRGIPNFGEQHANVVHVVSGTAPLENEVLTDVQDAKHGLLRVRVGGTIQIISADGAVRALRVSGEGRNLDGGQSVTSDDVIVLYANPATVASLGGVSGYDELDFRLADTGAAAITQTVAAVDRSLSAVPGFGGFGDLPQVRAGGDWPGKAAFSQFTKFFDVITLLALLSALVLISNTVTTLVAEQTSEIGIMEAIGGRRRQIAAIYLETALLLGALGTALGIVAGIALANALTRYFGSTFFAVTTRFGVDWRILGLQRSGRFGCSAAGRAPAIRRAVKVPVRDALEASGSAAGGQDAGDRLVRRIRFLPAPRRSVCATWPAAVGGASRPGW